MNKKLQLVRALRFLFIVAGLTVITLHIGLGDYSFPQADDFPTIFLARTKGWFNALTEMYFTWGGRFASLFLTYMVGLSPLFPYRTNLFMVCNLALFAVSLAVFLFRLNGNRLSAWIFLDIAYLFLALPIGTKIQTFYFLSGTITYLMPVWIACAVLAFIARPVAPAREMYVVSGLCIIFFILGGFNEQFSAVLFFCLAAYLIANVSQKSEIRYKRLRLGLLALGLGIIVAVVAPGNYRRLEGEGGFGNIITIGIQTWNVMAARFLPFVASAFAYSLLRAFFMTTPQLPLGASYKTFFYCVTVVFIACFISFFTQLYGLHGKYTVDRTFLLPCVLSFGAVLLLSAWMVHYCPLSRLFGGRYRFLLKPLSCLLLLPVAPYINGGWKDLTSSLQQGPRQRNVAIMQLDQLFKAKKTGQMNIIVPWIPNNRSLLCYSTMGLDGYAWPNWVYDQYFGVRVRAAP